MALWSPLEVTSGGNAMLASGPTSPRSRQEGLPRWGLITAGYCGNGECNVGDWTDIIQIAKGFDHTVGLMSDGTVVAVGLDYYRQCDVDDWTEITQIAAGWYHTVGLRSDGTVVAAGLEVALAKWNLGTAIT
jgi:alpha-tubulin suppressor-like RCC1 family protein